MKKILLTLVLIVPLSGCANIGPAWDVLTGSVASTAPVTVGDAEKALTIAHLALNDLAPIIIEAAHNGTLHGTNATSVKSWYDQADNLLHTADALDVVANAQGVMDKVNAANALIVQIHPLVPGS